MKCRVSHDNAIKTYYKMCKHHGNDEGCNAAMDAMHDC